MKFKNDDAIWSDEPLNIRAVMIGGSGPFVEAEACERAFLRGYELAHGFKLTERERIRLAQIFGEKALLSQSDKGEQSGN